MAPKTCSGKEVEDAAMILMQMADPSSNASDADEDKENESNEMTHETSKTSDQQTEHAKNLLLLGQAAVVHSATPSQSDSTTPSHSVLGASSQPVSTATSQTVSTATSRANSAVPSQTASVTSSQSVSSTNTSSTNSASTPIFTGASMAALTVEQRNIQQTRFAMTSQERADLGLKAYHHYDLSNNQIGTLWQTKNENRTFRQTQRRQGAMRLRAGTTTGLKFPNRRRA